MYVMATLCHVNSTEIGWIAMQIWLPFKSGQRKPMHNFFLVSILSVILFPTPSMSVVSNDDTQTISEDGWLQMIVEIPAGTNKKIEFDKSYNEFLVENIDGFDRVINFLPYPVNYGFIPSTHMDKARGGDGDPLDIMLISESIETGTVIDVIPIGVLELQDSGEIDTKIVAIPAEKELRIISATTYEELSEDYGPLKLILKLWFTNYKNGNLVRFKNWGNEEKAEAEITKWSLK